MIRVFNDYRVLQDRYRFPTLGLENASPNCNFRLHLFQDFYFYVFRCFLRFTTLVAPKGTHKSGPELVISDFWSSKIGSLPFFLVFHDCRTFVLILIIVFYQQKSNSTISPHKTHTTSRTKLRKTPNSPGLWPRACQIFDILFLGHC